MSDRPRNLLGDALTPARDDRPVVDRLHDAVTAIVDQLGAVAGTLSLEKSPGDTGREMIALSPMLGELGYALVAWDESQQRRSMG